MTTNTPKRISELDASDAILTTDIAAVVRPNSGLNTRKATIDQILQPLRVDVQNGVGRYAVATGSSSAYAIAPTPAVTAYVAGQMFTFSANHTNTGAVTLAVSGLSAVAVKRADGSALNAGEIVNGQVYTVIYNGTDFVLPNVTIPPAVADTAITNLIAGATAGSLQDLVGAGVESGTWTVGLSDGTNNATMEAAYTTGRYVRIGKLVTVTGICYTSSVAGLSGTVRITGLPFTPGSGDSYAGAGSTSSEQLLNITAGHKVSVTIFGGSAALFLYVSDDAGGSSALTVAEWSNDGFVQFTATYITA